MNAARQERITRMQRRLQVKFAAVSHDDFFRLARWWDLEARRGYASAGSSRWYAANMLEAARRRVAHSVSRPWTPGWDVVTTLPETSR